MNTKKYEYDCIFCGYYGFDNVGDDAVLEITVNEMIKCDPEKKIAVISKKEYPSLKKHGVAFIDRGNIISIAKAMKNSRQLIFGGGSLLQDVTSRRSLLYYAAVLSAGRHFCEEVSVFANGIGPLDPFGEKVVSGILKKADRVSVRDPKSYDEAIRLGACAQKTLLSADPVFLIDAGCSANRYSLPKKYFAVSLRQTVCGRNVPENEIVRFCRDFSKKGITPVFISMQDTADGEICARCAAACGGRVIYGAGAEVILSVLSGAEFSVGMRLHFLFLSVIAGIPTVGLSYDMKIDYAFPYAGGEYIIPAEKVTAKTLSLSVGKAQKNADSEKLRRRCSEMRSFSERDIMSLLDNSSKRHTLVKTLYSKSV